MQLHGKDDIKIFILYLMHNLSFPMEYVDINDVVVQDGVVGTIDCAECFAELLDNLVELLIILLHVDGHAGELGIFARRHVEGVDVIAATGEQTCYAGKHTKLVFHEHGDGINRFVSRHNV